MRSKDQVNSAAPVQSFIHRRSTMEDDLEDSSEWKKLKENLTVIKPLIPLKVTMLLYYGGKFLLVNGKKRQVFPVPFGDRDRL